MKEKRPCRDCGGVGHQGPMGDGTLDTTCLKCNGTGHVFVMPVNLVWAPKGSAVAHTHDMTPKEDEAFLQAVEDWVVQSDEAYDYTSFSFSSVPQIRLLSLALRHPAVDIELTPGSANFVPHRNAPRVTVTWTSFKVRSLVRVAKMKMRKDKEAERKRATQGWDDNPFED